MFSEKWKWTFSELRAFSLDTPDAGQGRAPEDGAAKGATA